MIACHEADVLIARRIDGEETTQDARALDVHLAGCPACARQLEAQRAVHLALAARLTGIEAPAALAARVRQRLDAEPPVAATPGWLADALNVTGALVAVAAAVPVADAVGGGLAGAAVVLAALAIGGYPLLLAGLADAGPADADPARSSIRRA